VKLPSRVEAGLQRISKVAAIIAAVVLAVMMMLTVADVCGRYFFNRPIKGTWEIIGLLLVCAGSWGLGYCQMQKSHISVTVLLERFSPRGQAIIRSLAYLIGLVGFSLLCWRVLLLAQRYFTTMKSYVTDTLEIPYSPFMLLLSIGAGIMALMLIVELVHSLTEVVRK
jgi:TRAP-type C4-dicarboxylate transport system permease small subunit